MNKIIAGIVGTLLTVGVAGGAAYALFSSQATVYGININAGSASLLVGDSNNPVQSSWNTGLNLTSVYPGYQNQTTIFVKNDSASDISLAVAGQLTAATVWPTLEYAVQVAVNTADDSLSTGWMSLAQWNAAPVAFPGNAIAKGATEHYIVHVRVPTTYADGPNGGNPVGNEINGLGLTNVTFTLTGTQTP